MRSRSLRRQAWIFVLIRVMRVDRLCPRKRAIHELTRISFKTTLKLAEVLRSDEVKRVPINQARVAITSKYSD